MIEPKSYLLIVCYILKQKWLLKNSKQFTSRDWIVFFTWIRIYTGLKTTGVHVFEEIASWFYIDVSKILPIYKQFANTPLQTSTKRLRRNLIDIATKYQPLNSCVLTWNGRRFVPCSCTQVWRQCPSLSGREFTVLVNTLNFQWRDFVYSVKEITVTKQTRFKLNESRENLIVRGPFKNWSILKRLFKYVLVNHEELAVKHCTEMLFEVP